MKRTVQETPTPFKDAVDRPESQDLHQVVKPASVVKACVCYKDQVDIVPIYILEQDGPAILSHE